MKKKTNVADAILGVAKARKSPSKKVKTVKLLADEYTISWCMEVTSVISEKLIFSENTINSMLNMVLASDTYPMKSRRLIETILREQSDVPNISDTEIEWIISILV